MYPLRSVGGWLLPRDLVIGLASLVAIVVFSIWVSLASGYHTRAPAPMVTVIPCQPGQTVGCPGILAKN